MDSAIPIYDCQDQSHKYAWDVLASELTNDDYHAIQMALMEREEEHEEINKTTRFFIDFSDGCHKNMMQPRVVTEDMREAAHRYVDWDCGLKIWLIMSKYAKFFSKL